MPKVRVTLINGRIVEGTITVKESTEAPARPVLMVDGVPYTIMDAVLKGMSVFAVNDPLFDRWQNTFR